MNPNTSRSADSSATTSDKPDQQQRVDLNEPLSEAKYLAREAERASAAMRESLKSAFKEVGHGVDPRAWTHEHPWWSMGAAVVAGFAAAHVIVPSQEEQLLKRMKKIEEAIGKADTRKSEHHENGDGKHDRKKD